jgi:hypothetical protein
MAYVKCRVSEGLRPSEATVGVSDLDGSTAFLRVERYFLRQFGSEYYLPIGVVHEDRESGAFLIELPHEADSGVNRVWVPPDSVKFKSEGAVA